MKTNQISGFINHISDIQYAENGTAYRNVILGRGENETSYSLTLFGVQARLASHELKKGSKVKFSRLMLSVDKKSKGYVENKIANVFSLVAMDWVVLEEFDRNRIEPVIENGHAFSGFANHITSGETPNGIKKANLLLGTGVGKTSFSYSAFKDAADVVASVQKGSFVKVTKVNLMPVLDETTKSKNLATKFFLTISEIEIRQSSNQNVNTGSQNQGQPAPAPTDEYPADYAQMDDDIPF